MENKMNDSSYDRRQVIYDMKESHYYYEEDLSFSLSESNEIKKCVADLIDFFYHDKRDITDVSYYIQKISKLTNVYLDEKLIENFKE